MIDETDAILDDILSRWHHWASSHRGVKGYGSRALVCGDFKVSRQYDDANGALDDDIERTTMETVDFQVSEMADPWRAAVFCNARTICTGVAAWRSPRLPENQIRRAEIVVEARMKLIQRLTSAGVM